LGVAVLFSHVQNGGGSYVGAAFIFIPGFVDFKPQIPAAGWHEVHVLRRLTADWMHMALPGFWFSFFFAGASALMSASGVVTYALN
jgi:hypothetical protein